MRRLPCEGEMGVPARPDLQFWVVRPTLQSGQLLCLPGRVRLPQLEKCAGLPPVLPSEWLSAGEAVHPDVWRILNLRDGTRARLRQAAMSPGEVCRRDLGNRSAELVNMWCAVPCSEKEGRLCPEGFACMNGDCARLCNEDSPGSCRAGERCTRAFGPTGTFAICDMTE